MCMGGCVCMCASVGLHVCRLCLYVCGNVFAYVQVWAYMCVGVCLHVCRLCLYVCGFGFACVQVQVVMCVVLVHRGNPELTDAG